MTKDRISELTLGEMNMINDIFSGDSKIKILSINEKDEKIFKYTYKTRGFSIGCQPKDGFIKFEEGEHKFETIFYDRKLSEEEVVEYELIDLN